MSVDIFVLDVDDLYSIFGESSLVAELIWIIAKFLLTLTNK